MLGSAKKIVIIGTGGTIAGGADNKNEMVHYSAGEKKAAELLFGLSIPQHIHLETIELCQIDSKDMCFSILKKMAVLVNELMKRKDVDGVVITHGTDTLEETGVFLKHSVKAIKPIVLTASMRPSTALSADGPINLLDSIMLAVRDHAGIFALINNKIYLAEEVLKAHTLRVDGFSAGEYGAIGHVYNSEVEFFRAVNSTSHQDLIIDPTKLPNSNGDYPWVEVVYSDVSANPRLIPLLVKAGVEGLIIVGTGNGTIHENLWPSIEEIHDKIMVTLSTRVLTGKIINLRNELVVSPYFHAAKARIWTVLKLLNDRKS